MTDTITVLENGRPIAFSFEDLMRYHGFSAPGGVAHAFKVLERALPLLDPDALVERREIHVRTAFGGPGARDGLEMVTRAVSDERFAVDAGLGRPELGRTRERFVFRLGYRDQVVTLVLRDGVVTEEFIALARKEGRTATEEQQLDALKLEMADRLMSRPAHAAYDAV